MSSWSGWDWLVYPCMAVLMLLIARWGLKGEDDDE